MAISGWSWCATAGNAEPSDSISLDLSASLSSSLMMTMLSMSMESLLKSCCSDQWLDESDAVRCMTDTPMDAMVSADLISLMFFFLERHDVMTSARSTPQRYLFMAMELHYFNPDVVISREHFLIELFEARL